MQTAKADPSHHPANGAAGFGMTTKNEGEGVKQREVLRCAQDDGINQGQPSLTGIALILRDKERDWHLMDSKRWCIVFSGCGHRERRIDFHSGQLQIGLRLTQLT
jgi:hypothetical protein